VIDFILTGLFGYLILDMQMTIVTFIVLHEPIWNPIEWFQRNFLFGGVVWLLWLMKKPKISLLIIKKLVFHEFKSSTKFSLIRYGSDWGTLKWWCK